MTVGTADAARLPTSEPLLKWEMRKSGENEAANSNNNRNRDQTATNNTLRLF
jgi:hypothetical protein